MQMARTVRLLGRVRRPEDETEADLGYGTGRAGYTAGAERQTVKSAVSNRRPPEGKSRQRHQHGALGLGQFRRPIPGVIVPAR